MYLMQPQADIDEIKLETMTDVVVLAISLASTLPKVNSGSPMDLERMYVISLHLP